MSCVLLVVFVFAPGSVLAITDAERDFFESKIRPVLIEHCYQCHNSADSAEGGLAVDHRAALHTGGDGGAIVVPGKPDQSRLIKVLRHEIDGLEMPQGGPRLEESIVRDFESWIQNGAPDPRDQAPSDSQIQQATSWQEKLSRRKQWWSFQQIASVEPPSDAETKSLSNPIDRFVTRRLVDEGLTASPRADSASLVRRLYFNLTGLPPTADEAIGWTTRIDTASDGKLVIEELVDQLLASDRFGERWARHWMDWIRYA
ncbi:MAG: DUF1549 domain-containing protein, partial [Planctomycetales bacterium]|nr:DUF1549 domain-containing protein [Planctomycetales bacterium]